MGRNRGESRGNDGGGEIREIWEGIGGGRGVNDRGDEQKRERRKYRE